MYTEVQFKDGQWYADGKIVINAHTLIPWLKKVVDSKDPKKISFHLKLESGFTEGTYLNEKFGWDDLLTNTNLSVLVCPLHYVMDGFYAFVCGFDLYRPTTTSQCGCGVPYDVHGTCCEWINAKHVCDENLIIRDSRHPFYRKSVNDWINRPRP